MLNPYDKATICQFITEECAICTSVFTTEDDWTFGKENILSKSKNSAFLGQKMKGKAIGIYNNGQLIMNK
jgi:dihydroorotase-like cyclic amidohydrolase